MKRTTSNKLNMYERVHAAMNDYQTIWQDISALSTVMDKFTAKLDLLKSYSLEQTGATIGVSHNKQLRKNELLERMLIVERALMLHGMAIGDVLLQDRNKHSKSDLFKMSDNKLVIRCTEIKADLDTFGSQLGAYGVDATVAELTPMLQDVETLKNTAWKAILKRKGATQSINELEREIDKLLNIELDNLMLVFQISQPAFFQAVSNARMVIDYKSTHGTKPPQDPADGGDGAVE